MKFDFTPEEAQGTAQAVAKYYSQRKMKVKIEIAAWPEVPYRTTLVAIKAGKHILIEAQGTVNYSKSIQELAAWLAANRHYSELYLATMSDAVIQADMLAHMKKDGVGLLMVDDEGKISVLHKARNPALVVTPDPTLKYGEYKTEVNASVQKFNETDRKDGLRDMCELVERETEELALVAVKKNWLKMSEKNIKGMDWSTQINTLASTNAYNSGHTAIVTSTFKDDLHSFRNARNLLDHKVSGKRDDMKRQKQFAERMMQGPRLIAEMVSLKRKIK